MTSHPPLDFRERNIWTALYFCLMPTAQQWCDVRMTELERTGWVKALRKSEARGWRARHTHTASVDLAFVLAYYKVRMDFLESGVRPWTNFDRDTALTLFAAKTAAVGVHDPIPEETTALVDDVTQAVDEMWGMMSSGLNCGFAQSAPSHWFRTYADLRFEELHSLDHHDEGTRDFILQKARLSRIVRDPVFKIVDDWMSSIHRYRMDDDEGARIRASVLSVSRRVSR